MKVDLLLHDVEVEGRAVSVAVRDGHVVPITDRHDLDGADELFGAGAVLLPGLHDHHLHLLATAAARTSVDLTDVAPSELPAAQRAMRELGGGLPAGAWVRVVGYHEGLAGELDRHELDRWLPHRPVRVQDRTGARWTVNSAGVAALHLQTGDHPGIDRDTGGVPTGVLHRADEWLRARLPADARPDLGPIGQRLSTLGVTGVTDTTAWSEPGGFEVLAAAHRDGLVPQRITVTGGPELAGAALPEGLRRGPVKVVLDDAEYPSLDLVVSWIEAARAADRPVAVHTVTAASAALAVAALQAAGPHPGDRLEHGAVLPPDLLGTLHDLGLTVVTQPAFIRERGDRYLTDVEPVDLPDLYRLGSLLDAGIPVAASTDAPYGDLDPWAAMRSSVMRRTRRGVDLGPAEAVDADTALRLWLGSPEDPGGPPRRVAVGAPVDLVLCDRPLADLLEYPCAEAVVATVVAGRVVHHR